MAAVSAAAQFKASADQAWAKVGSFEETSWIPGNDGSEVSGEGVGATRSFKTPDGGQIVERLEAHDAAGRSYTYSIVEAPMPIQNYQSTIAVKPAGDGSEVSWSCTFEVAPDLEETIVGALKGLYEGAMAGLKESLG